MAHIEKKKLKKQKSPKATKGHSSAALLEWGTGRIHTV